MTEEKKESMPKNTAAALSYVLGPITGIVFLLINKDPFVRFHAMQSTVIFLALMALQWVMTFTIILIPIVPLVTLVSFVLWLVLIYKAYKGEEWEVPYIGKYTRSFLKKL